MFLLQEIDSTAAFFLSIFFEFFDENVVKLFALNSMKNIFFAKIKK